jgi:hypothetical protein
MSEFSEPLVLKKVRYYSVIARFSKYEIKEGGVFLDRFNSQSEDAVHQLYQQMVKGIGNLFLKPKNKEEQTISGQVVEEGLIPMQFCKDDSNLQSLPSPNLSIHFVFKCIMEAIKGFCSS